MRASSRDDRVVSYGAASGMPTRSQGTHAPVSENTVRGIVSPGEGRFCPGKSPSPLSPSPALANFRPPSTGFPGPTPSASSQQFNTFFAHGSTSPVTSEHYCQRSPTSMMTFESGNHRANSQSTLRQPPCNRRSPLTAPGQYLPPPPMQMPSGVGRRNIFDDDANAEAMPASMTAPRLANPNSTVSGSVSPLSEGRYGYVAHNNRAMSAATLQHSPLFGQRSPGAAPDGGCTVTGTGTHRGSVPMQRAASSVSLTRPLRPKTVFRSNCGTLIDEFDPYSGRLVTQYRCGCRLGTGGFAEVFEVTDISTQERFACKIMDKVKIGTHGEEKVRKEVEMHRRMNHPNILRMYKLFADEYYFFIILELCSSKNLMEVSNERHALPTAEVQHIMRQLTSAVEYMHRKRIIHRDIKLGNIMIDFGGNVKLGDFGFASELMKPGERKTRLCGTPNYIAPEILAYSETKVGYGFEADIWSLGVLLFILAFGYPPFESRDVPSTYARIRNIDYRFPSPPGRGHLDGTSAEVVPKSCKELIASMLQRDPSKRPTPREILQSPFLHSGRELHPSVPQREPTDMDHWRRSETSCKGGDTFDSLATATTDERVLLSTTNRISSQRFTPLQQDQRGSRVLLGGTRTPSARQPDAASSPFAASPILTQSPYTVERGSEPSAFSPLATETGRSSPLEKETDDGARRTTAFASPDVRGARELFPPACSAAAGNDVEPCKTLHEFLQDNDPSSPATTTTATTGSEHADGAAGPLPDEANDDGQGPWFTDYDNPYYRDCQLSQKPSSSQGQPRPRHRDVAHHDRRERPLPAPPQVYVRNALHASKYGFAFTLMDGLTHAVISLQFNDRTKLVYDREHDTAYYVKRVRSSALTPNRATSDPDGTSVVTGSPRTASGGSSQGQGCCDALEMYVEASRWLQLGDEAAGTGASRGKSVPGHDVKKKFAIATFLSPLLLNERSEATYPMAASSLKYIHLESCRNTLFTPNAASDTSQGTTHSPSCLPFVKAAYMANLVDLNGGYAGVDMLLMAARFSNQSCQITVMCRSPCPISLVPTAESPVVSRETRWRFDMLVYSPYHAVFGIETKNGRFYESFNDIRRDVRTTDEGRRFFSAASTSPVYHEFMIPEELLHIFAELLSTVKAPDDFINCFRYRK